MKPGAVIVDVAIDQGGCIETSRPTTHRDPTYVVDGVVHYCVTNMPGAVGRTSTYALSNVTLPYVLQLARNGWEAMAAASPGFAEGINIDRGRVTNQAVAATFGLPFRPLGRRGRLDARILRDGLNPARLTVDRPDRPMPMGDPASRPLSFQGSPPMSEHEHEHDARARARPRRGEPGAGPRARHPEPDLPGDEAAEPRPAQALHRGRRPGGQHPPVKSGDLKNAVKNIWDLYSEFYSWVDPEEAEGDEEDEDSRSEPPRRRVVVRDGRLGRRRLDGAPPADRPDPAARPSSSRSTAATSRTVWEAIKVAPGPRRARDRDRRGLRRGPRRPGGRSGRGPRPSGRA